MDNNALSIDDNKLVPANLLHLQELHGWFKNQHEITYWGGPGLAFPIAFEPFVKQIRFHELASYSLINQSGQFLAFGQFYQRLNRHHLGRLAVSPKWRGKGLSKQLINGLIELATRQLGSAETSLFVMRDNAPALGSYQSLGFIEQQYPGPLSGILADCAYLVRTESQH